MPTTLLLAPLPGFSDLPTALNSERESKRLTAAAAAKGGSERKGDRKFLEGFLASSRHRAIDVRLCTTTDATARAAAAIVPFS